MDRVALVCGSSQGLGFAAAESLAQQGIAVVICARKKDRLNDAYLRLKRSGATVLAVACDLAQGRDIERLLATTLKHFGRIDILVTNTTHPKGGGFATLSESDWEVGHTTIFLPTLLLLRGVVPVMKRQGSGRIIHLSSHVVREPDSRYLLSSVYRTALNSLLKSVANEVGKFRICVNTVCPGLFRTPLGTAILAKKSRLNNCSPLQAEQMYVEDTPNGRIGEPEQLGALIVYLCSESGAHLTGQTLLIDGGRVSSLM